MLQPSQRNILKWFKHSRSLWWIARDSFERYVQKNFSFERYVQFFFLLRCIWSTLAGTSVRWARLARTVAPSAFFWVTTNLRNPNNGDRRSGKVPTRQEQRNKTENKPTQYLTRFDNLPSPRGKGDSDFIDSTINYNLFLSFKEFPRGIFRGILQI